MAKRQFKSESKRLLDLMINSIYTHKEIFLREIISNASDALDKMNYKLMTDTSAGNREDLAIKITVNEDERTVTVSDNGIGMTADDMVSNLGTIARSGTLEFRNALESGASTSVIGQFGVGFYSAFMVSNKVSVVSRAYGSEKAAIWESSGADGFTIKECEKDGVGTDVIMHIKPDTDDDDFSQFLDTYRVKELVNLYSDYIHWPIRMDMESGKWVETGEKDENGEPKKDYVSFTENKIINSMMPIWEKSKNDATDEECYSFYKSKFHDFEDPLSMIRVNAEGSISYKAMLFIPKRAPYDFYSKDFKPGLQLYSANVLIMERCADLLPNCFRFVRGVVSSQDFSLNISRETLQHDAQLRAVGSNLTKKVKAELVRMMSEKADDYAKFYDSFGRQLKYGIVEGYGENADMLKELLMFYSSRNDRLISMADYVKDMPSDQPKIYYVTADTVAQAKRLPQSELVLDKGYDILCMTEDVDEFVMKALREYDGKEICNITSDDTGFEASADESGSEESKDLLAFAKESLSGKVVDVKASKKLKNHAVLLSSRGHVTLEMEKYFSQFPGSAEERMKAERVLEINTSHPVFSSLEKAFSEDREKAKKLVGIMYAQACITAGIPLDDAAGYSESVFSLF